MTSFLHAISRRPVLLTSILLILAALALSATAVGAADDDAGRPLVIEASLEGTIDPVADEFVARVIKQAREDNAAALVFRMDTPGGLSTSMDEIVKRIVNEKELPVVVYVAPGGARAGSAGAFITMASDVAAMAPGTTIGSATPITSDGQDIGKDLRKKVINDASSKMRTLARERGRDEDTAEAFVREAENVTADEALEKNVIEYVADSLPELLQAIDGDSVEPKGLTLDVKDARIEKVDPPLSLRILKLLVDPNLIFLLFSGGLLGLAFELTHPGTIFPGVAGVILLVFALFGIQVLPTAGAGVALLLLAVAMFAAEALVTSHGVLGGGGAVSLFLGGLLLFEDDSGYAIDLWLLLLVSLSLGGGLVFIARKAMQAQTSRVRTGAEFLVGEHGVVRRELDPDGTVFVQGELWQARNEDGTALQAGARVRVTRMAGMTLHVVPDALVPAAPAERS